VTAPQKDPPRRAASRSGEPTDVLDAPRSDGQHPGGDAAAAVRAVLEQRPTLEGTHTPWRLVVPDGPTGMSRVFESLLAVADGVTGTRGSLEEEGPDSQPGVFVADVYDRHDDGSEALVVVRSWANLIPFSVSGNGRRVFDLHAGVLWREAHAVDGSALSTARWACLARPGTTVIVAQGSPATLGEVAAGSEDVDVRTAFGGGVRGIVTTANEPAPTPDGVETHVARVATYMASRRVRPSRQRVADRHAGEWAAGPARLLAEQQAAWAQRWEEADVEVVGDEELTQDLRLALFHLMASVADRGEAAVGARGITGPGYSGHVFWDADVFVLPVLAATHPAAARAMLEYRIRRIPAAREDAAALGRSGTRFPWESAHDGHDVTPRAGIDHRGELVPILTGQLEEHITADVAWAAWQLASWTGSWRFLDGPGRPLLTETARYWASRIRLDGNGRGHIDGVIGPDEYHENVDDNAFTNQMAAWNLRHGAALVGRRAPRAVAGAPGADEAARWRALADALVDGYDEPAGRHIQFSGFDALEPLLVTDVGPVPVAADLVLGHARVQGSQIVKQADVLMGHHMIGDVLPAGSLAADMDFYLPRTAHGSSLSPAIHAGLLARLGRLERAVQFLDIAQRIDRDDVTGTSAGGLHVATLGGLWQAVVTGFAGVRVHGPDDDTLVLDPHIPTSWEELRLRLRWHGRVLRLRCWEDRAHVRCRVPVKVQLGAQAPVTVSPPGGWVVRTGVPDPRAPSPTVPRTAPPTTR